MEMSITGLSVPRSLMLYILPGVGPVFIPIFFRSKLLLQWLSKALICFPDLSGLPPLKSLKLYFMFSLL